MNSKILLPLVKKTVAISTAVACTVATLGLANTAEAKVAKRQKTSSNSQSSAIRVNPKNLRIRLLNGDTSIMLGLNQLYMSKVQVASSQAALLPSLNLTAALGPSFLISSFTVLLPFLLPSNWANLSASEANLAATGYGYYALELNEMANVYAIYEAIVNDMDIRDAYVKVYNNYNEIYTVTNAQYSAGAAQHSDLKTALTNVTNAQGLVRHADEIIAQELSQIRLILGIPDLDAKFEFDREHMAKLNAEGLSAQTILNSTYFKSPERDQMLSLIKAAQSQKISAAFSFLNNAAVSFAPSAGGGVSSFNSPQGGVGAGLSFTIFPLVNQAQLQIEQYQIRLKQVRLQEGQLVESSLHSTRDAVAQVDYYTQAMNAADAAFADIMTAYRIGTATLDHADLANNAVQTATLNLAAAQLDLDGQRVTLARELIVGQYAAIHGCHVGSSSAGNPVVGFFSDVAGIFALGANKVSIDQVCKN